MSHKLEAKFKKFFSSTQFLTNGLMFIGAFVMFIGAWMLLQIFGPNVPENYYYLLFALVIPFFIIGCWVMVRRKEYYNPGWSYPYVEGGCAVIQGILGLIALGIAEIIFMYELIKSIIISP